MVEFAPGLGFTANLVLKRRPKTHTGIELNGEAASTLRKQVKSKSRKIFVGNAAQSSLESKNLSSDKVYGEAMLTMQVDKRKSEIQKRESEF